MKNTPNNMKSSIENDSNKLKEAKLKIKDLDYVSALQILKELEKEIDYGDWIGLNLLIAKCLKEVGDYKNAINYLNKSINGTDVYIKESLIEIKNIYTKMGNIKEFENTIKTAELLYPNNGEILKIKIDFLDEAYPNKKTEIDKTANKLLDLISENKRKQPKPFSLEKHKRIINNLRLSDINDKEFLSKYYKTKTNIDNQIIEETDKNLLIKELRNIEKFKKNLYKTSVITDTQKQINIQNTISEIIAKINIIEILLQSHKLKNTEKEKIAELKQYFSNLKL